jgi:predicted DNA repair protein MutK
VENRKSFLLQVPDILEKLNTLGNKFLRFEGLESTMELFDLFIEML